jgi:hypothetical protein
MPKLRTRSGLLTKPVDRRRIGAIFLIVPGGGAGVEIEVAPLLLLA